MSGQRERKDQFIVGPDVRTFEGKNKQRVLDLVKRYHLVLFKDPYYKGEFWTKASKESYKVPDYMLKQEFSYYNYDSIVSNVVGIFKPDDYYAVQMAYNLYENNLNKGLICVYTFAVKEENDSLKFFPIIETYKFKKYVSPLITMFDNDSLKNEQGLFDSLQQYNIRLSKMFKTDPARFTCYKFRNFAEINQCVGLDVQKNYSRTENNAYCDAYNKIIFGAFYEVFFHELVHLYVGDKFINTYHIWINEGLATYLGGSMSMSLDQHLYHLAVDLESHPRYDLGKFLEFDRTFVENTSREVYTSYKFTLGGLICKLAYEKGGMNAVFELLSSGRGSEDLYQAVEKVLGVKRENFNVFFRNEVARYLK